MYAVKRKIRFEDYKHSLEATQVEHKINHLQQKSLTMDDV